MNQKLEPKIGGHLLALVIAGAALAAQAVPASAQQQCQQPSGYADAQGNCPAGTTKGPATLAGGQGALLLKLTCYKAAPCAPLGVNFNRARPIPAHRPQTVPVEMCKQKLDGEFKSFTDRIQRGMAAGVISPQEQGGLKQNYDALKADEAKMAKDGLSPQECAQLNANLTHLNTELAEALCTREPTATVHAAMSQAVQTAANVRHGNLKVATDPKNSLCVMEIQHEAAVFHNTVLEGKRAGLIDQKEAAQLDAAEKRVHGLEQKALADSKVSREELKHIVHAMRGESAELDKALASKPSPKVAHAPLNLAQRKAHPAKGHAPKTINVNCKSIIDREFKVYTDSVALGLKAGVISDQERGELEKEYNGLKGKEQRALGDGKLDPKECAGMYDDLADLNYHLASAMCSREPPAGLRASLEQAAKQAAAKRHPNAAALMTNNPNPLCMAQIQREIAQLEEGIAAGTKAGMIDAKEMVDLQKGLAKVAELEKKAMSDKSVTPAELQQILAAVGEENKKLDAAMSTPAKAALAKK